MTAQFPFLPPNTILPNTEDIDTLVQYWNRTYEEIAYNVNARDFLAVPIAITSTAQNLPIAPQTGAYIILVSGFTSGMPSAIFALTKSASDQAGLFTKLQDQDGNIAPWTGKEIIVSSTTTNFQIRHNLTGVTGNFKLRIVGTQ